MLVVSADDVRAVLTFDLLVPAMAEAMAEFSAGSALAPHRVGVTLPESGGLLTAMTGFSPGRPVLGTKLVTLYPDNAVHGLPGHQAVIVTFDPDTGAPDVLLDGTLITEMRTAACSALATDLLAARDARVHAVLGTGAQAAMHARAISHVRPVEEVRICGRDAAKAAALAGELSADHGLPTRVCDAWQDAVRDAHVVSATTHSDRPIVTGGWLAPGTHVNSVGFNPPGRELDDTVLADALVVVDSRAAATSPPPVGTNDIIAPVAAGVIDRDAIVELGELAAKTAPGRTGPRQITVYKAVGVAVQDCAAAGVAIAEVRRTGRGADIRLS